MVRTTIISSDPETKGEEEFQSKRSKRSAGRKKKKENNTKMA